MSVIYTDQWYEDMKQLVNSTQKFRELAPREKILATFEVMGDEKSPYVTAGNALYYLIRLEGGQVAEYGPLPGRHDGKGLNFRFTAPASLWEEIAAGIADPIQLGLRGTIKVRGDMRFLMQHAEAVKILVDMYGHQNNTEWPKGRPPYSRQESVA
ncbi:MAG: SCP2 sterol-binding domain-containing protein [Deltaproteobacteria bacterium]|nr:SCP2 sterol-binding domain-containing protein [Deltaproteobacteria bacterium]